MSTVSLNVFLDLVLFLQLTHPLCDRNLICARHDAISEISESMGSRQDSVSIRQDEEDGCCAASARSDLSTILSSVLTMLGRSLDSQRGITRIFHCKATAKEVRSTPLCVLIDFRLELLPQL